MSHLKGLQAMKSIFFISRILTMNDNFCTLWKPEFLINDLLLQPFYTKYTSTMRLNLEISLPVKGSFAWLMPFLVFFFFFRRLRAKEMMSLKKDSKPYSKDQGPSTQVIFKIGYISFCYLQGWKIPWPYDHYWNFWVGCHENKLLLLWLFCFFSTVSGDGGHSITTSARRGGGG